MRCVSHHFTCSFSQGSFIYAGALYFQITLSYDRIELLPGRACNSVVYNVIMKECTLHTVASTTPNEELTILQSSRLWR